MDKNKLRKIRVWLCITATGKSSLVRNDERFVDADIEESDYKYGTDSSNMSEQKLGELQGSKREIVNSDSEEYIHSLIIEHIKNGKIVLNATHSHMFNFLDEQKIPYGIVQYHPSLIGYYRDRMKNRGNSDEFVDAMLAKRNESYERHKNRNAAVVFELEEGQFLSDLMWDIFGKPQNQEKP